MVARFKKILYAKFGLEQFQKGQIFKEYLPNAMCQKKRLILFAKTNVDEIDLMKAKICSTIISERPFAVQYQS